MNDITIIRRPQGGSGDWVNVGIDKGQFLATESQTTFNISQEVTDTDLLMIHVNNLYLEKDINYSIVGTTITVPALKLNDSVSWILIKVGQPITPEVKQAICGLFNCGEISVGEGLNTNIAFELIKDESSLSEDFLKNFC